ncbi:MAG: DUF58 domain-containing protein [Syntrophorhabdaceae bacterium]|jgi:uncharacterized protein (DUF58 family)|nr:DUF58 domain-containing protein [Syntrophorhabdaceae bacterium]
MIVSALLSFMSISGIFGKNNLSKIALHIDFPQEIYAHNKFPVKVTIRNLRRFLPAFLIRLKTDFFETLFPFTDTRGGTTKYVSISLPKRGLYHLKRSTINSVFPFNFFTRFRQLEGNIDVVVFPELRHCELYALYAKDKKVKGEKASDKIGFESDIVSIREYVHGDPLKYIHWKATAKTGKLKTKELSTLTYRPIVIDFEKVTIRDIEEKISCIAYSIVHLLKKNIPIGLKINNRFYEPGTSYAHKISMLKELALYDNDTKNDPVHTNSGGVAV